MALVGSHPSVNALQFFDATKARGDIFHVAGACQDRQRPDSSANAILLGDVETT